ncbi:MAG: hypothetical protein HQL83_03195 [Magnetococcales bacterium]|nr:hypothetical protein [Magnetococcales bacterium]
MDNLYSIIVGFLRNISLKSMSHAINSYSTSVILFIVFIIYPLLGSFLFTKYFDIPRIMGLGDNEICLNMQFDFLWSGNKKPPVSDQTTDLIQSVKSAANNAKINELVNLRFSIKGNNKQLIDVSYRGTYEKFVVMAEYLEEVGHQISELSIDLINEEGNIDLLAIKFSLEQKFFPSFHTRSDFNDVPHELYVYLEQNTKNSIDEQRGYDIYAKEYCKFDLNNLKSAKGDFPKDSVPSGFNTFFSELKEFAMANNRQKKRIEMIADSSEEKKSKEAVQFRNPFHEYVRYNGENYLKIPNYYKLVWLDIKDAMGEAKINGVIYRTGDRFPRSAFHKDGTPISYLNALRVHSIDPKGFVLFRQDDVYPDYLLLPALNTL